MAANIQTIPDESTGSSIVTVINYGDRNDANVTTQMEHASATDNCNRNSGRIFGREQRNDNNAIETSIRKCIQATKSLSIQSNESPAASPPKSVTLNAIASDKYYMGSGTKIKKCKTQFFNEPSRIIIVISVLFLFFGQNTKIFNMYYVCAYRDYERAKQNYRVFWKHYH